MCRCIESAGSGRSCAKVRWGSQGCVHQSEWCERDAAPEKTFLGRVADKAQFDRVMDFLKEGKKDKVEVLAGGARKGDKGHFVEPTVP